MMFYIDKQRTKWCSQCEEYAANRLNCTLFSKRLSSKENYSRNNGANSSDEQISLKLPRNVCYLSHLKLDWYLLQGSQRSIQWKQSKPGSEIPYFLSQRAWYIMKEWLGRIITREDPIIVRKLDLVHFQRTCFMW